LNPKTDAFRLQAVIKRLLINAFGYDRCEAVKEKAVANTNVVAILVRVVSIQVYHVTLISSIY